MKIQVEDLKNTRKKVTVSVEASEIDKTQKKLLGRFAREVRIPGFRPGKAPSNIILQRYGRDVAEELERKVTSDAYQEIVGDSELKVCALVDLEAEEIQVGQPAELTFLVDVEPEVTLPEYKGITVTLPPSSVTEEDVEKVIDDLRSQRADYKEKAGPAEASDFLQLSYEGTFEGRPLEEIAPDEPMLCGQARTWEQASAEMGSFPGLAEQLIGLAAGDEKDITVDFAEDFVVEALRGKSVLYAVKVMEVREMILPELDEEFLEVHQAGSVEELKETIRQELVVGNERKNRVIKQKQILDFLVENTEFDLPQSDLDNATEGEYRFLLERRLREGKVGDDPDKFEAVLREDAAKEARRRVKIKWVMEKISTIENIQVEGADIEVFLNREAYETNQTPKKIVQAYNKDRGRLNAMQKSIEFDKTLDFLVEQSTVAENQDIPE